MIYNKKDSIFFSALLWVLIMVNYKNIKIYLLFTVAFWLLFFSLNSYHKGYIVEKMKRNLVEISESGEWLLADSYDSENSSFEEFLQQKNAKDILNQTYKMLKKQYGKDYFDVGMQSIEYIGKYKGSMNFVNGDEEAVNQKISHQEITPLKSVQISSNCMRYYHLDKEVEIGKTFQNSDYKKDASQEIPIIAGADYRQYFQKGDTFYGKYLGEAKIKFVIKGFFKKNTNILLADEKINLDSRLVFPSIQISSGDEQEFQKILLSVKCQGYFHYESLNEFEKDVQKLKKIKKTTGFQYVIPMTNRELRSNQSIDMRVVILWVTAALLLWMFIGRKVIHIMFQKKRSIKQMIKRSILTIACVYGVGTLGIYWYIKIMNETHLFYMLGKTILYSFILYMLLLGLEIYKRRGEINC